MKGLGLSTLKEVVLSASMLDNVDFLVFLTAVSSGVSGSDSRAQAWTFKSKVFLNDQDDKRNINIR